MKPNNYKFLALYSIVIFFAPLTHAACPVPPTSIDPGVTVNVSFDKKTGLYTYQYIVTNGPSALVPIEEFNLQIGDAPSAVFAPEKWNGDFLSSGTPGSRISWDSALRPFLISPNSRKSGFSFKSEESPGLVRYYSIGKSELRQTMTLNGDDEAAPDCPGFYDDVSLLESMVSGITQGPVGTDRLSVDIELKDSKGEHDCGPVSPYEDKGLINVLVKGRKDLEVKEIDLTSLRFGVGKASVVSSRNIGSSNNLLLQFKTQDVAIECGRDRVLFLTGKMKDGGKDLLGGAPVKTKNCDKRPKRKIPKHFKRESKKSHDRH